MIPAIQYQPETSSPLRINNGFYIEPTASTPFITFNPTSGILEFKGKSSPENAPKFFQQVDEWFEDDSFTGHDSITINMGLTYFNTSSCKCLFMIFRKLSNLQSMGKDINVNWYFEEDDEDMMEAGEDFSEIFNMQFNMIEIED
ncbi:MAG: DUF1987 domain-containing protein [Cyclobacteriaceae bacterium]